MSKAYNRSQREKALQKAMKIANLFAPNNAVTADKIAHRIRDNRKACSCNMCCNPRHSKLTRGHKKLTIQERKRLQGGGQ